MISVNSNLLLSARRKFSGRGLKTRSWSGILSVTLAVLATSASADDGFFAREVQPILARHCFACHGPDDAEGGVAFNSASVLTAETDSGLAPIVPGDADASEMIRRILSHDEGEQMPPEGKRLSKEQIAVLQKWINDGADYARHWAFEPVTKPEPPAVMDTAWVRSDIDRFVLARLEAKGLHPVREASRRDLIRRVTHDLIGLPPTYEEVEDFVADDRPEAYSELIERLLASPHYGERWGRHWLDVVRYAESNSFERDNPKPNAWKFRDYVINSFNNDKPYDQFLREHLAGDELETVTPDTLTGTGYLRLGIWDDEPADPELHRYEQLDDLVSTTGQSMLGLTVGCARCHDHKIDPVPQKDYYSLVAFFSGLTEYARRGDQMNSEWSQIDTATPEAKAEYARIDTELRNLAERMHNMEEVGVKKMSGPDQRRSEGSERRKLLREKLQKYLDDDQWSEYTSMRRTKKELENEQANLPGREFILGVAKADPTPPAMHLLQRGMPAAKGEQVEPAFISILGGGAPTELKATDHSSGRRRALAEWVASPDNILTARVALNRIWQHHFGRGIVRSPNNFGLLGTPPTHPELLDWLATEFVESGWSIKAMHRLIMNSATYRLSNDHDAKAADVDPGNDLFWRRDLRRMDAEEVRDSVLAVAGTLNTKMGGPSVYPKIEEEVRQGLSQPDKGWPTTTGHEANRRSVYIFVKRSLVVPILAAFDYPDPDSTCEARFKTTQPSQSLALLNSEFLQEQSAEMVRSIESEGGTSPEQFVTSAFERVLCRRPEPAELASGVQLIADFNGEKGSEEGKRLFCLLALNLNEFVYLP